MALVEGGSAFEDLELARCARWKLEMGCDE